MSLFWKRVLTMIGCGIIIAICITLVLGNMKAASVDLLSVPTFRR